jgi:hypothetical protein
MHPKYKQAGKERLEWGALIYTLRVQPMKYALTLFIFSAFTFVGCDPESLSDGDSRYKRGGGVSVKVSPEKETFVAFSTKGKSLEAVTSMDWHVHSLEDFICLQRLEQVKQTLETISFLEGQIKTLDATSPRTRELRKEIFETRTQLLEILSDIEDAKIILAP